MRGRREWRNACVVRAQTIAKGVRMIDFAVDGPLPQFEPGSHTEFLVEIGGAAAIRSYTCLPAPRGRVRVAVRYHDNSRGGSRFMWSLIEGAAIKMTVPENRFELSWRAPSVLLIAGGIGITPIYGMAKALAGRNVPMRLAYGGRARAEMAFAGELQELLGDRMSAFCSDVDERIDLAAEIEAMAPSDELYICGPVGMLEEARRLWSASGRPPSRFRCEVFGDSGLLPETTFTVSIANSNIKVDVAPDMTMLGALQSAGIDMIYECERGECGLCALDVLAADAEIDHRDVFFSAKEKASGERICACVSRLAGGTIVVDTGYRAKVS